jgi:hypothetical protein
MFNCTRRWCHRSFKNIQELFEHTSLTIPRHDSSFFSESPKCSLCDSPQSPYRLFEKAVEIQESSGITNSSKVSRCALEIAKTACGVASCPTNKADQCVEVHQGLAEVEPLAEAEVRSSSRVHTVLICRRVGLRKPSQLQRHTGAVTLLSV